MSIRTAQLQRRRIRRLSLPVGLSRRALLPLTTAASVALLLWLALPLVWWTPLNVGEELPLRVSDFSFANIFDVVSTKRGGGPLHFWLEHYLLGWWPSVGALRIPSLVFLCLALPAVAPLARRLRRAAESPRGRRPTRAPARRRRGVGRCRAAPRCVADPGAVRDVRPAAHLALRVADVGDRARA